MIQVTNSRMATSSLTIIILYVALCTSVHSIQLSNIKYYETIEVQQPLRSQVSYLQSPNGDEQEYSFFGLSRNFQLKLRKNNVLINPDPRLIHQADDGGHLIENDALQNCYYQGELLYEGASSVVVSTCGGRLNGFLKDSNGVEYGIAPHPDDETKHVLYKDSDVIQRNDTKYRCGFNNEKSAHYSNDSQAKSRVSLKSESRQNYEKRSVTGWKYIEVIPVVSNQLYKKFRRAESNHDAALKAIWNKVLHYMNIADSFYKMIDTRVVVTNLIVWDRKDNGITTSHDADASLTRFTKYVREEIYEKMQLHYDHVTYLTVGDVEWGDHLGLAYLGYMCMIDSTSVNRIILRNTDHQIGDLLAHEIAHSLGLHHTADCGLGLCHNPPCLMSAIEYYTRAKGFSQCNLNHFKDLVKDGELPCILNYPEKTLIEKDCNEKGLCHCAIGVKCNRISPDYKCVRKSGDGEGDDGIWFTEWISDETGHKCVSACRAAQKTNVRINGATFRRDGKPGCWCELGIQRIISSNSYETCFLVDNIAGPPSEQPATE